jgi:hypothetical protein
MMSIYPTAVGHWLATAHCLFFWAFFRSFFFCLFSEILEFCIGTRHRGDWGGRRYCFLFLFVLFFFLFCFSVVVELYNLGAAFGGNPGIYQTRYHSVQELF